MNDFTFRPLTLSEVHLRRRVMRPEPFFGALTGVDPVSAPKNDEDEPEVLA